MGPNFVTDYRKWSKLGILARYLTDSELSPLRKYMIDIEDPYASEVSFVNAEILEPLLFFEFKNAPVNKIDSILNKFMEILDTVRHEEKIDRQRMKSIIDKTFLEAWGALESNPYKWLAHIIIGDCVYGTEELNVSI